jgi:hypothetical protein
MFRRPPPPSFVMCRSRTSKGLGTYGRCVGTSTCNRVGRLQQDENNTVYLDVCFHVCMPHAERQFLSPGSGAGLVTRRNRSLSCAGLAMNVVRSLAVDQSIALPEEGISLNIPQYAVSRRRYDTYRSRSTQGLLKQLEMNCFYLHHHRDAHQSGCGASTSFSPLWVSPIDTP